MYFATNDGGKNNLIDRGWGTVENRGWGYKQIKE